MAGATFNIFHAPARRVKMANIAQLVSLVNLDPKAPVTVAATIQGPKLEG